MRNEPFQLGKLTRREFRTRMQAGELKACIVPVAAIEQHLEHLAMEHDWRSVSHVAVEVARNLAPHVLIAEGMMAGISEHHMQHPGTISLRPGTFIAALTDVIRSVIHAGFQHVLVLNGHGGNVVPCQAIWDQLLREFQVNLQFMSYWDTLDQNDANELLKSGHRLPEDLPGHAQEFETALGLAAFPDNVRTEVLSDQADPAPAMATEETGRAFLQRIVPRVTRFLQEMIDGQRSAEVPPFY